MKLFVKLFDLGNHDRLLLGVIGSLAADFGIEPIILRFVACFGLAYFSLLLQENYLGTAIVLYVASYLASAFAVWLFDNDDDDPVNFEHILFANWIANH